MRQKILLLLLMLLSLAGSIGVKAQNSNKEAYYALDKDMDTDGEESWILGERVTFYYDDQRSTRGETYLLPQNGGTLNIPDAESGIYITFDSSFANYRPTNTSYWFSGLYAHTEIQFSGWEYFNTSELTDVTDLFRNCRSLTSLDLSNFDTSHVTNMYGMFRGCSNLVNINLSNFNTENVRTMDKMFSGCSSLANLDLGNFETSHVSGMKAMFSGCSSLANLDLGSFDTKNVLDMACMFSGCSSLTNLDLGSVLTQEMLQCRFICFMDVTN